MLALSAVQPTAAQLTVKLHLDFTGAPPFPAGLALPTAPWVSGVRPDLIVVWRQAVNWLTLLTPKQMTVLGSAAVGRTPLFARLANIALAIVIEAPLLDR